MKYTTGYKHQLFETFKVNVYIFPSEDIVTQYISLTHLGVLKIKKGYAWDGISGPTFQTKTTKTPSLIHDSLYQLIRRKYLPFKTWQIADLEFKRFCLEKGMNSVRAWWLYRGLKVAHGAAARSGQVRKVLIVP